MSEEERRRSAQKGGEAVSEDREHMSEIGRKGGESGGGGQGSEGGSQSGGQGGQGGGGQGGGGSR